jgi:hypothetical protein
MRLSQFVITSFYIAMVSAFMNQFFIYTSGLVKTGTEAKNI